MSNEKCKKYNSRYARESWLGIKLLSYLSAYQNYIMRENIKYNKNCKNVKQESNFSCLKLN